MIRFNQGLSKKDEKQVHKHPTGQYPWEHEVEGEHPVDITTPFSGPELHWNEHGVAAVPPFWLHELTGDHLVETLIERVERERSY